MLWRLGQAAAACEYCGAGFQVASAGYCKTCHPVRDADAAGHCTACGGEVDVLLRPDDVVHDDLAPLRARIVERVFRGAEFLYTLQLPSGRRVLSLVPSHHDHRVGELIGLRLATDHVVTFPPLREVTGAGGT